MTEAIRPRLKIAKRLRWPGEDAAGVEESIQDLVQLDFESQDFPPPHEILVAWPNELRSEIALFSSLNRALAEAIEEAADAGFLHAWDRASGDIPSIAEHPQNANHEGFFVLVRVLAGLWERIAVKDPNAAHVLAEQWANSPYLLMTRLRLFALSAGAVYEPDEAAGSLLALDDHTFWASDAQVEIMRLMVARWGEFSMGDRDRIEGRLRPGMPRTLFTDDAFPEEEWMSIQDGAIFKRFKRIAASGSALSAASSAVVDAISARHPRWRPSAGDRDDFRIWFESGSGPQGHPDLLLSVPDNRLVAEAMRLQQEQFFEEGDLWNLFCSSDPERAFRGLRASAQTGEWNTGAWQTLLGTLRDKTEPALHQEIAELFIGAPDTSLEPFLPAAVAWLQGRREALYETDGDGPGRYFRLWDKLANITFRGGGEPDPSDSSDPLTAALNAPGGMLARTLEDTLAASKPTRGQCLGPELTARFNRAVDAEGKPGLLARVIFARSLDYLEAVDPAWVMEKLVSRFTFTHADAPALWQARAYGQIGSPGLFNALKPALLETFERRDGSHRESEGLVAQLLLAIVWHRRDGAEYEISAAEVKRALTVGPSEVRHRASWYLGKWLAEGNDTAAQRAECWRNSFGPLVRDIWPLDARLRDEHTSRNFVAMAVAAGDAFPDAVATVVDFLVPYQLYRLIPSFNFDTVNTRLVEQYPRQVLHLVNALIDSNHPIPNDLGEVLRRCLDAEPGSQNEPSYTRLFGLSRRAGA